MKLYIDTRERKKIVVSIIENDKVLVSKVIESEVNSETLLALIEKSFKDINQNLDRITEISVERGPGSYTGTRVGVAIANSLSFALLVPVNGKDISSLESPKY